MSNSAPDPTGRIKAKAPAKAQFAATILLLEAFVVFFATLVLYGLRTVPSVWPNEEAPSALIIWSAGGLFALILAVLSRGVAGPGGYLAGSLVQLPLIASGFVLSMMFVLAAVFVALWVAALRMGGRIDRERAAYDASHPETAPNVS